MEYFLLKCRKCDKTRCGHADDGFSYNTEICPECGANMECILLSKEKWESITHKKSK